MSAVSPQALGLCNLHFRAGLHFSWWSAWLSLGIRLFTTNLLLVGLRVTCNSLFLVPGYFLGLLLEEWLDLCLHDITQKFHMATLVLCRAKEGSVCLFLIRSHRTLISRYRHCCPHRCPHSHPWNLGICPLKQQNNFANVVKLRMLRCRNYLDYLGRYNVITRILIKKEVGNSDCEKMGEEREGASLLALTTEEGGVSQGMKGLLEGEKGKKQILPWSLQKKQNLANT